MVLLPLLPLIFRTLTDHKASLQVGTWHEKYGACEPFFSSFVFFLLLFFFNLFVTARGFERFEGYSQQLKWYFEYFEMFLNFYFKTFRLLCLF